MPENTLSPEQHNIVTFSRNDTKAVKGLAVLLMLYHHLFGFPDRIAEELVYVSVFHIGGNSSAYLIGNFGQICVSVFLMLGGYGTYLSCCSHANVAAVICRKIRSLYLAYWRVFAIVVPVCVIAGVSGVVLDFSTFLKNFTGIYITYCGEWWFFTVYIASLILYPALALLLKKSKKFAWDFSAWVVLCLVGYWLLPGVGSCMENRGISPGIVWGIFKKTSFYLPIFFSGCVFAKYDLFAKIRTKLSNPVFKCVGSVPVLLVIFVMRISTGSVYDCLYTPVFITAAYLLLSCPVFGFLYRLLLKIGNESTTIWLVHSVFCYMLCQRLVFFPVYTPLIFVWLLVLSYVTAVGLSKFYLYIFQIVAAWKDR